MQKRSNSVAHGSVLEGTTKFKKLKLFKIKFPNLARAKYNIVPKVVLQ